MKSIITHHETCLYSITLQPEEPTMHILYNVLKMIIPQSFYDETTHALFFNAESVHSLQQYLNLYDCKLPYTKCIGLADYMTTQINYLQKSGYGYYGFDIDDIIVIDKHIFAVVNTTYLMQHINNTFCFYAPINYPYFSSPELLKIQTLPSEINYNTCYYSLGALIAYCLFNTLEKRDIELIHDTKLYWFFKRCFETKTRSLLLI